MKNLIIACSIYILCAYACEDGVDNVLPLHDLMKGRVAFQNVELLTYDSNKNPSCIGKQGVWNFPGKIIVNKPIKESEGELKLHISLEKNSWMIGTVCENGKSKNQFVPAEICDFPLCKFATEKCKLLEKPEQIDLVTMTSTLGPNGDGLVDMGPLPGEWALSVKLMQGARKLAAIAAQEEDQWFNVASAGFNPENVVKTTHPAGPAPPGSKIHDEF